MKNTPKTRCIGLGLIFTLALALRLAVFFQSQPYPQLTTPVLDARYYLETGRAIAHGGGYGPTPYFMNPGYLWLVAVFDRLFADPQTLLTLFQIILDSFTCVLAAVLARRLFGSLAGLFTGLFLALNGFQILSATKVLPETAAAFLMAVFGLVLIRCLEKPSAKILLAAGAILGGIALLRGNALLILPFLFLALRPQSVKLGWRTWIMRGFLLAAGTAAVIAPVTLRNLIAGGDAVLISSSGGVNFYLGNARGSDGRFISLNQLPLAPGRFDDDPSGRRFERSVQAYAEEKEGRLLRPSEVSGFWTGLAREEIGNDFLDWLKHLARKTYLFFNAYEIPQIDNLYFLSRYLPVLKGPLSLVSRLLWPLALFGFLALLFRRGEPKILLWVFGGYALSVILFFATARHRLPIVPIAAALSGFGTVCLVELFRNRHPRRFAFALLFAGCFLFSNLNPALGQRPAVGQQIDRSWFGVDGEYLDFASQHNNMAALLLERGNWAEAERECREGLKLKPYHSTLLYNLGRALEQKGDLAGAKEVMERSLAGAPENPIVSAHLGEIYYKTNDFTGALKALESAVQAAPQMANAWNSLGPTRFRLGDTAGALAALAQAQRLVPNWVQPRYNRGIMLNRLKRFGESAALFDSLRQIEPENRQVLSAYAEALIGQAEQHLGKREKGLARAAALRVLSINPDQRRALEILKNLAP